MFLRAGRRTRTSGGLLCLLNKLVDAIVDRDAMKCVSWPSSLSRFLLLDDTYQRCLNMQMAYQNRIYIAWHGIPKYLISVEPGCLSPLGFVHTRVIITLVRPQQIIALYSTTTDLLLAEVLPQKIPPVRPKSQTQLPLPARWHFQRYPAQTDLRTNSDSMVAWAIEGK